MGKIGIVGFHNLHLMQFLYKYTEILDRYNVEYDVLYWNRDGVSYKKRFNGTAICFEYLTSNYCSKLQKVEGFLKCRDFFIKTIKKNKYDKLILLTTQTSIALFDIVLSKYKGNYIFDYRDITGEKNYLYLTLVKQLIRCSYTTAISSPGFVRILGDSKKYMISHNCCLLSCDQLSENKHDDSVIKITFWGMIRQLDYQKRICDLFGNDPRFELYYHGEGSGQQLKEYCVFRNYNNITFTGRYYPEQIKDFAEQTDILMNLYENEGKQEYALTVKLYDGIRYGIPMLVSKGSFMESFIGNRQMAYYFSFSDTDKDNIVSWYKGLDKKVLRAEAEQIIEIINRDERIFENKLLEFAFEGENQ